MVIEKLIIRKIDGWVDSTVRSHFQSLLFLSNPMPSFPFPSNPMPSLLFPKNAIWVNLYLLSF